MRTAKTGPDLRLVFHQSGQSGISWNAVGGRGKERELLTTSLEFEFHPQFPCGSPSTELSDFRQHKRECKTGDKGNFDVITNVISANQHFAFTFSMQIFKCQSRPAVTAPRRACSQTKQELPYGDLFLEQWLMRLAVSLWIFITIITSVF